MGVLAWPHHVGKKRAMNPNSQPHTHNMNQEQTIPNLPHYEIKIEGRVDDQWQTWFYNMVIFPTDDGNTMLRGLLTDQAALYGV